MAPIDADKLRERQDQYYAYARRALVQYLVKLPGGSTELAERFVGVLKNPFIYNNRDGVTVSEMGGAIPFSEEGSEGQLQVTFRPGFNSIGSMFVRSKPAADEHPIADAYLEEIAKVFLGESYESEMIHFLSKAGSKLSITPSGSFTIQAK